MVTSALCSVTFKKWFILLNDWVNASAVTMTVINSDLVNTLAEHIFQAHGNSVFCVPITVLDPGADTVYKIFGLTRVNLFYYFHLIDWVALTTWQATREFLICCVRIRMSIVGSLLGCASPAQRAWWKFSTSYIRSCLKIAVDRLLSVDSCCRSYSMIVLQWLINWPISWKSVLRGASRRCMSIGKRMFMLPLRLSLLLSHVWSSFELCIMITWWHPRFLW